MGVALIDLVNSALATLGEQPLVDLETQNATSNAILVKAKVPVLLRALLMETDWNCARITSKLSKISESPKNGYLYTFQLPTDPVFLKIVQISIDAGETFIDTDAYYNGGDGAMADIFDIDGDKLLSDSPTVTIKYTGQVDAARFDPLLASAFEAHLSAEMAYAITASASLAESLNKLANKKTNKAKSRNALNRNPAQQEGAVISSRYRGNSDRFLRCDMSGETP